MAGYERWLVEVRAEIAPERLVEWQPGDGWEPICGALGVPIPNLPFPHENSTADYVARAESGPVRGDDRRGGPARRIYRVGQQRPLAGCELGTSVTVPYGRCRRAPATISLFAVRKMQASELSCG